MAATSRLPFLQGMALQNKGLFCILVFSKLSSPPPGQKEGGGGGFCGWGEKRKEEKIVVTRWISS